MLAKIQVIRHRVELWRIVFRKGRMSILAMKAFLEAINPSLVNTLSLLYFGAEIDRTHIVFQLKRPS